MKKMMAGIVALMILVCGCAAFAERTLLTEQDAMEAALAHVRLTKEEVTFNRVHMGWDDGRQDHDGDWDDWFDFD